MAADLAGVRIWLSGSVPDEDNVDEANRVRDFVKQLATRIFALGGTIAHGCHPSLMPTLTEAAHEYKSATGDRAPLAVFVSRLYSKHFSDGEIESWNSVCREPVEESPEAFDSNDRSVEESRAVSLSIMRQTLASRCNAIVAIGGKWWTVARDKAGVAEEIDFATRSQLPLFLIGGMGGAVMGLVESNPELFRNCANGLSVQQIESLANQPNPGAAVSEVVEQLQRLPLRAIAGRDERPYRILCLDGGGIRGAYTAAVLAYWERALNLHTPGRPRIVDHFDLIAGTSTGGILAIGLALGMSATEMVDFYRDRGPIIFGSGEGFSKWWHSCRHWFTSKFDQSVLRNELQSAFDSSPVGQSGVPQTEWLDNPPCKLLIPVYNTTIDKPDFFRTPYGRFVDSDKSNDPVTVALATAAAPTYFKPVDIRTPGTTIKAVDGGVWANSPVSVAIAEATAELKVPVKCIHVLNIGTTFTTQLTGQPMQLDAKTVGGLLKKVLPTNAGNVLGALAKFTWKDKDIDGLVGWAGNIAGLLMKSQAQTSEMIGNRLLGDRFVRVDSESPHGQLDDVKNIDHFISLGQSNAKDIVTAARIQALFLNGVPATQKMPKANMP